MYLVHSRFTFQENGYQRMKVIEGRRIISSSTHSLNANEALKLLTRWPNTSSAGSLQTHTEHPSPVCISNFSQPQSANEPPVCRGAWELSASQKGWSFISSQNISGASQQNSVGSNLLNDWRRWRLVLKCKKTNREKYLKTYEGTIKVSRSPKIEFGKTLYEVLEKNFKLNIND